MQEYGGWEVIEPLGKGGQSEVFKVRTPKRAAERRNYLEEIRSALDRDKRAELAIAIYSYARPEVPSELGALKIFKIREQGPDAEQQSLKRLMSEITVLKENRPGLLKLLDSNEAERWIVTEYYPAGALEKHPSRYKGQALLALRAFRSLAATVASLHKDKVVHRDIKPANVFIGTNEQPELVLGDFGIVFLPGQTDRVTATLERVGPRDYMPPWADYGVRLDEVQPNFDVYMLGKLLWCMVAGRPKLPREYHKDEEFDLTVMFNARPDMQVINTILDMCLVEKPAQCLESAEELLKIVDQKLAVLESGGQLLSAPRRCRVCGKGFYRPVSDSPQGTVQLNTTDQYGRIGHPILIRPFVCNVCTHHELFAPGYPEEAAKRT